MVNIQEVAILLKQPGRRFLGPTGQDDAATYVQAHVRGYLTRQRFKVQRASFGCQYNS